VDLSSVTGALVNVAKKYPALVRLQNCKLGSGVTLTTGTNPSQAGTVVELVNCDSADTNYRYQKSCYQGNVYHETAYVRTGGASDGTTAISRKMVSSANTQFFSPLESDPIVVWNETVGSSVTVTVEVITDGVTLTNAEAWIEVEYLGTSGVPLSLFASDRAANIMTTPENQAASTEVWATDKFTVTSANATAGATYTNNGETFTVQQTIAGATTLLCSSTGAPAASGDLTKASGTGDATIAFSACTRLATPVYQKLSVAVTPQEKGPIKVRVMLAKASTTMYFCPKAVLS